MPPTGPRHLVSLAVSVPLPSVILPESIGMDPHPLHVLMDMILHGWILPFPLAPMPRCTSAGSSVLLSLALSAPGPSATSGIWPGGGTGEGQKKVAAGIYLISNLSNLHCPASETCFLHSLAGSFRFAGGAAFRTCSKRGVLSKCYWGLQSNSERQNAPSVLFESRAKVSTISVPGICAATHSTATITASIVHCFPFPDTIFSPCSRHELL